ncbi:hypothetical protein [Mastigocladopsis repens]|uniref:hypothetical protein n=1 Tax=Mastigocladopsis repens TaxID=221287 RepID=UPI0003045EDC|nr:hypothetical protein [Mastigocladopsis repens]
MKSLQHVDPVFEQLFAKIPREITDTFTEEQLEAIKNAFGSRHWTRHPLDLRFSVPIPGLRFYVVLLAGSERRSKQRLRYERGIHPLWTPGNIVFLIGLFIILLTSSFTTFSFVFSLLTSVPTSPHPTSIPWLHNQSECKHTGRTWRDGKCWDYEHNPMF